MYALEILEHVHWHDHWSVMIGEKLSIEDSTSDLLVFSPVHTEEEIAAVLTDIPQGFYRLFRIVEASPEDCQFQADSGTCYIAVN